jgi:hypothetical protein
MAIDDLLDRWIVALQAQGVAPPTPPDNLTVSMRSTGRSRRCSCRKTCAASTSGSTSGRCARCSTRACPRRSSRSARGAGTARGRGTIRRRCSSSATRVTITRRSSSTVRRTTTAARSSTGLRQPPLRRRAPVAAGLARRLGHTAHGAHGWGAADTPRARDHSGHPPPTGRRPRPVPRGMSLAVPRLSVQPRRPPPHQLPVPPRPALAERLHSGGVRESPDVHCLPPGAGRARSPGQPTFKP